MVKQIHKAQTHRKVYLSSLYWLMIDFEIAPGLHPHSLTHEALVTTHHLTQPLTVDIQQIFIQFHFPQLSKYFFPHVSLELVNSMSTHPKLDRPIDLGQ